MSKNPVFKARTKYIEVDYHFVREQVFKRNLQVSYISTTDQPADAFIKPLPRTRHEELRDKLHLITIDPQFEGVC